MNRREIAPVALVAAVAKMLFQELFLIAVEAIESGQSEKFL